MKRGLIFWNDDNLCIYTPGDRSVDDLHMNVALFKTMDEYHGEVVGITAEKSDGTMRLKSLYNISMHHVATGRFEKMADIIERAVRMEKHDEGNWWQTIFAMMSEPVDGAPDETKSA